MATTVESGTDTRLTLREAAGRVGLEYNKLRWWADSGHLRTERDVARRHTTHGLALRLTTLAWVEECRAIVGPRNRFSPEERHPLHRLDRAQVATIKQRLAVGDGLRSLARAYNVAPTTIRRIRDGLAWPNVRPEGEHTADVTYPPN